MPLLVKRFLPTLLGLGMLGVYFLLGLDSFKNSGKVEKYLFIDSTTFLLIFIVSNLILRTIWGIRLSKIIQDINKVVVLTFSSLACIMLSLVDYFTPTNFVFDRLLINYQILGEVAIGSLIIFLINSPASWLKKNYKSIIFYGSLIFLFILWIIRLWPNDVFLHLVKEDNFIENSQFFALLFSSLLSFYFSFKMFKKSKLFFVLYLLASLGLFFVSGDEISWGQRLLGISSPDYFTAENVQREINIHNLSIFDSLIGYAYITVGLYGAFSWVMFKYTPLKNKLIEKISPPNFLFFFFFSGFFYNFLVTFLDIRNYGEWSEVAELMLHLGVLFFLIENIKSLKSKVTA